ncbi:hypothetical protein GQ53DRAFT_828972 [Thozetella sp. PMI_491]|nr:hypothetical protein GQ53DRAFT_828972 [Thozetella sp. PMI_491]
MAELLASSSDRQSLFLRPPTLTVDLTTALQSEIRTNRSSGVIEIIPWVNKISFDIIGVAGRGRDFNRIQNDILSLLIKSNNFANNELCDQLLTFLAAGHETTSAALSWVCYLLAKHKDVQSALRAEVRRANMPFNVDAQSAGKTILPTR